MMIDIDRDGTKEGLKELLERAKSSNAQGVMLLACDANDFTPDDVDGMLKDLEIPVFGGIFPEILYQKEKLTKGSAALFFTKESLSIHLIKDISNTETDIAESIGQIEDDTFNTMFVYLDAFSTSIQSVISELYYEFGVEGNFIGGGAGSLSFEQKPVIFTNEGLLEDAVVFATLSKQSAIGVKYGWESIAGPLQITQSDKNTIIELDYKPAYEVYKEVVERDSGQQFTADNFFDIAKGYPFGVSKVGSEKVVRDPITVAENALVCVGNVTTGDYVDILSGSKEKLVEAARSAYVGATEGLEEQASCTVFIDCISRVLFLQEDFQEELDAVAERSGSLIGALTLGEIANTGDQYLEFYNKTAVVGVF
jgi:hypothetical protein